MRNHEGRSTVPVGVLLQVVGRICLRSSLLAWAKANSFLTGYQRVSTCWEGARLWVGLY